MLIAIHKRDVQGLYARYSVSLFSLGWLAAYTLCARCSSCWRLCTCHVCASAVKLPMKVDLPAGYPGAV